VADVTVKKIEDLEAGMGGGFKYARQGLGVESFGLNVLDIPPGYTGYPEHDHTESGQEEVYIPVAGSATLTAGGEEHRLEPGMMVRVAPGVRRKIVTTDEHVRVIALGGTPGKAYEPG
jgi:uncharacterized cupin superfamily protein